MPKNCNLTQLDPGQVIRQVFDDCHDSVRVHFDRDHEMSIELSAADGDSVITQRKTQALPINQEIDASLIQSVTIYLLSEHQVTLMVSPVAEGDVFVSKGVMNAAGIAEVAVCALRIKLVAPEGASVHLLSQ